MHSPQAAINEWPVERLPGRNAGHEIVSSVDREHGWTGRSARRHVRAGAAAARALIDGAARRHGRQVAQAARDGLTGRGGKPLAMQDHRRRSGGLPRIARPRLSLLVGPDASVSGRNREGTRPRPAAAGHGGIRAMRASQPLIVTACATMPLPGPVFRRHLQHRVECRLFPVPAIEQQGVVGALGNRVVVLPRDAVVHAPQGHARDGVALAV